MNHDDKALNKRHTIDPQHANRYQTTKQQHTNCKCKSKCEVEMKLVSHPSRQNLCLAKSANLCNDRHQGKKNEQIHTKYKSVEWFKICYPLEAAAEATIQIK